MRTSMGMAIAALIGLGCGGGSSQLRPSAAPASPAVVELRASADSVCACKDDDCAQASLEKLLTREAELANRADQAALDVEHDRAVECYARETHVPLATELVPIMEHAADDVCACADEPCARAAVEKLRAALKEKENAVFTTTAQTALEQAGNRLQACADRLSAAPRAAPGTPSGR